MLKGTKIFSMKSLYISRYILSHWMCWKEHGGREESEGGKGGRKGREERVEERVEVFFEGNFSRLRQEQRRNSKPKSLPLSFSLILSPFSSSLSLLISLFFFPSLFLPPSSVSLSVYSFQVHNKCQIQDTLISRDFFSTPLYCPPFSPLSHPLPHLFPHLFRYPFFLSLFWFFHEEISGKFFYVG